MIATLSDESLTAPKQAKFLGATVKGLGVVTTVSSPLFSCYALIEDEAGREHHRYLADLKRDEVELPVELQPYRTLTRRVGIGTWDEVLELEPVRVCSLAVAA